MSHSVQREVCPLHFGQKDVDVAGSSLKSAWPTTPKLFWCERPCLDLVGEWVWTDEQAWSDGPVTKVCRQTYLNIKTLPWRCLICSWSTHHTAMSYLNKNLHLWIKTDRESTVLWLLYVSRFSKLCVYHHVTCGLSTHKNHEIRSTHAISNQ